MAGSASRIYNFCHANPNSGGCPFPPLSNPVTPPPTPPTNEEIQKVKQYLDEWNAASKAPFSAVTFGNAFTGYETFIGSGNAGPNGEPVDSSMYWRWASMTKLVGLMTLAAALEDGILLNVNEPVYKYIPAVGNIYQYVSDSTAVIDPSSGTPIYDDFGTPRYTQVITNVGTGAPNDADNLGKKITIMMLINSSSGFGYSFPGIGKSREGIVNPFAGLKAGQNYIAWLQNIEANNSYADTIHSSYNNMSKTFTESINERLSYPLLCVPGEKNVYDTGTTFIGAVISAALAQKGIQQTAAEYTQSRIFNPLGMTKSWLNCGSLNPPSDVLTKLTNAFFVRQDTPGNLLGSYQKGTNVAYNTLYGCFDASANGDGFKNQELTVYLQTKTNNYLSNDRYAGGYDWSGCGTMSDYCKLLKLLINKGYDVASKKQILSRQSVEWILTGKYTSSRIALGLGLPNSGLVDLLKLGNNPRTWCGGVSKFLESDTIAYATGTDTYAWGGYFGTNFIFDIQTGNYMFYGTQASGASWQLSNSTKPFQPDGPYIWDRLTSMF